MRQATNDRHAGQPPERVIALRSADAELIEHVRLLTELVGVALLVCPPGYGPPPAHLLIEAVTETSTSHEPWPLAVPVAGVTDDWARDRTTHVLILPTDGEQLLTKIRGACVSRTARIAGVFGARGGIGASSFAAVFARVHAQQNLRVVLVDLDGAGAGIDLVLGIEEEPGVRWPDLIDAGNGYDGGELMAALPTWRSVRVLSADWRGGFEPRQAHEVIGVLAGAADLLVLDLPRQLGWERWSQVCDEVIVLAGCDVMSAAGAQTAARMLGATPTHLVVRGPSPGGLRAQEVAEACGLTLAAQMRPERSMASALERGVAPGDRPGSLLRTSRAMMRALELDQLKEAG